MQNIELQRLQKCSTSLCYISLFFLFVEIYADDSLVGQLTNKKLIQLIKTLSFYDYELKMIAEMAKTNSIVLPFASKTALSATPIRVKIQNKQKQKLKLSFFINMQLLSQLSWQGVLPRHLHIYTASDLQKLIVNKLARFS